MKEIELTKGYVTQVDDETYRWAKQMMWYASVSNGGLVYAVTGKHIGNGKRRKVLLHRLICNLVDKDGKCVDHIDGDGLNNRKSNLRVCTTSQNGMNRKKQRENSSSIYKGVSYKKSHKLYQAQIMVDQRSKFLGFFDNEIDAAKAYDKAALEHFEKFAKINFSPKKRKRK